MRELTYREFLTGIDLPYEQEEEWQIRFAEKKINVINLPIHLREWLDCRARGASKTFDFVKYYLFFASKGFVAKIFCSGRDQLQQPKKYMDYLVTNSFMRYLVQEKLKESVTFTNGGELTLTNLTELNARSSRGDLVGFDEEAQANEDAYRASINILAGSELGIIGHISTPVKATIFEENHDRLKLREIKTGEQFVFKKTWYEVGFLSQKEEWYEEQKKIVPSWYFRQEHEASFELPSGAVFQNVIYSDIPSWVQAYEESPLCSGLDWNPVAGHWLVGGRWISDEAWVVQHAINLGVGYTHQLNDPKFPSTAKIYEKIRKFFMHGKRLCAEDGGINIAYCDWLREVRASDSGLRDDYVTYEEWDSSGLNKTNAVLELQSVRLYVDELLFPELAKQVRDAHWKEDATRPELAKDPADSPHALDALLHAVSPTLMRDAYIYREDW